MSDLDLTPEPDEIVQAESVDEEYKPVKVSVCGPVETRELPAIRAGYATAQNVSTSVAVKLLAFEPRRKSAVIIAQDQDIWLSNSQAGAQMGASSAFRVPMGQSFVIDHLDEVWACSVTGTTDISVMTNFWSQ